MGSTMTDAEIIAYAKYKNTDWQKVFFRTGKAQDHSISISGGSKNFSSYTSLGYFQQDGVLVDSDLQRFNFRNNLDGKSKNDKLNYHSTVSVNFSKSNVPTNIGGGAVNRNYALGAMNSLPHLSPNDYVYGAGTGLTANNPGYGLLALTPIMLLDRLNTFESEYQKMKILASFAFDYKIFDNITYRSSIGGDLTDDQNLEVEFPNSFNAEYFSQPDETFKGYHFEESDRTFTFDFINSLTYQKVFQEKHSVEVSLYSEYFKAHRREFGFFGQGLNPRQFYPGDGSGFVGDLPGNDYYTDNGRADIKNGGTLSFFATADYDFESKYGFAASIRKDASYRFKDTNKWGTFYSISGRWNLDKEKFMEESSFDLLKLRASYGTSGNQRIVYAAEPFAYFAGSDLTIETGSSGNGYSGLPASYLGHLANPNLKWETISQANVGLDFGLYSSRLKGNIDVYKKTTEDLFQAKNYPSTSGITSLNANNGSLINKGVELSLFGDLIKTEDFNLSLSFLGSYNKQERYGANQVNIQEGGKLGEYFVYRYQGVNPVNGNLLFLDIDGNLTEDPTDKDRVFTNKNRFADYQGSFGLETDFKGFYVNARLTYAIGVDRFDGDYQGLTDPTQIGTFRHSRDILDAWTPTNTETNIPSLHASNYSKNFGSDMYLQSADYFRLRMVSIGYQVPSSYISKFKLKSLGAYLNGENLMTFSGWRGYDVESTSNNGQWGYPTPRIITLGIKIGI
jgi:TonB-linked SusC/RagA family outer membrane protein